MNSGSASDMQIWAEERNCRVYAALLKGKFVVSIVGDHKTVLRTGDSLEYTMMDAVYAWDNDG